MVALKSDPVWTKISRFGHPYPPFDWGSGMGVEDVSREDAIALGVIKEDYSPPPSSPLKAFNDGLEASLAFKNDEEWQSLKRMFGDQIRQKDGKIAWRNDIIREAFTANKPFALELGTPTPSLIERISDSDLALHMKDHAFKVSQEWLSRPRKDGSDHRAHFYPLEADPRNIPLTVEDLELLPAIWREPDKVEKVNKTRLLLSMSSLGGGTYKAVVDGGGYETNLVTFYKIKNEIEKKA